MRLWTGDNYPEPHPDTVCPAHHQWHQSSSDRERRRMCVSWNGWRSSEHIGATVNACTHNNMFINAQSGQLGGLKQKILHTINIIRVQSGHTSISSSQLGWHHTPTCLSVCSFSVKYKATLIKPNIACVPGPHLSSISSPSTVITLLCIYFPQ